MRLLVTILLCVALGAVSVVVEAEDRVVAFYDLGLVLQGIQTIGEMVYVLDWQTGTLYGIDRTAGSHWTLDTGLPHVDDLASDGDKLWLIDESGAAKTLDLETQCIGNLALPVDLRGEVLGTEWAAGRLYLLVYQGGVPRLCRIAEDGTVDWFDIITNAGIGELIGLQAIGPDLSKDFVALDYAHHTLYRMAQEGASMLLSEYADIWDGLDPGEITGTIAGFYLDDAGGACLTSQGEPGRVYLLEAAVAGPLWTETEATAGCSAEAGVNGYAVVLEVDDHPGGFTDIDFGYINRDRILGLLGDLGWSDEDAFVRLDHEVTAAAVHEAVGWLQERVTEEDLVFFYVTAHYGYLKEIRFDELFPPLWASLKTDRKVLVVDSCGAGMFTVSAMYGEFVPPDAERPGRKAVPGISLAACAYDEVSWGGIEEEGLPIIGGVLTYYVVEALRDLSLDSNADSYVSVEEAFVGVRDRVRAYYRDVVFQVPQYLEMAQEVIPDIAPEDYPHLEMIDGADAALVLDLQYYGAKSESSLP